MKIIKTNIPEVLIIEPKVYGDDRGYFSEVFKKKLFEEHTGYPVHFTQINESKSCYGVLRGLHFQKPPMAQAKLVRVIEGKVLDIAVDIRKDSPTFGQYVATELSAENKMQMFIPRGFAHGFVVLSETASFFYQVDNDYSPENEGGIAFDDPDLNIDWKIPVDQILLSEKDKVLPRLNDPACFYF